MFISIEQIKAARQLLRWNQKDLAEHAGLKPDQVHNFESGRSKSLEVLEAIYSAFTNKRLVFKDGGVFIKTNPTTRFEGEDWYVRLLDDVYSTLLDEEHPEAIILFGDESLSPPEVLEKWQKIRDLGTTIRRIVREGNSFRSGPAQEYRLMPKKYFNNYVTIVYADKVAICASNNTMALVIKDAPLAQTFRLQTDFYFSVLEQPMEG